MVRSLLAVLLVVAAGCGSTTETAHQSDVIASPTPVHANPVSPTLDLTESPSPIATKEVIYETQSGLACYTDTVAHHLTGHGPNVPEADGVEGFSTLEEAVSGWWERRPDRFRNPEEPLFRSPIDGSVVAFRDRNGNAQLLLYGEQVVNGVWIIASAENCFIPPSYIPR